MTILSYACLHDQRATQGARATRREGGPPWIERNLITEKLDGADCDGHAICDAMIGRSCLYLLLRAACRNMQLDEVSIGLPTFSISEFPVDVISKDRVFSQGWTSCKLHKRQHAPSTIPR